MAGNVMADADKTDTGKANTGKANMGKADAGAMSDLGFKGFRPQKTIHRNLCAPQLYEHALARREARLASGGALLAHTGAHTGRSADDKFAVRDATTESQLWWDNNKPMQPQHFAALKADMLAFAAKRDLFVQDLFGGADKKHRLPTRVVTEYAWHSLFIRNLLIEPAARELKAFRPEFFILNLPNFRADPARHGCRSSTVIAVDFAAQCVLIGGTAYAGEIKKSVFTMLNYLLPPMQVMPMHCSVNVGKDGDPAVFFGLSGTGKTTLSADPERKLIGDDEHGWSGSGLFNFEGGCYAKLIRLSAKAEPEIHSTTARFGTVLENVVMDEKTRALHLDDDSLTENTRGGYPLAFIPNASASGRCGHPKNIIMLTADAFGVLPPMARLTPSQAMYHFLSGYTAKIAGTERGISEPQATFSTCFGAPFMPRHPSAYGNLLRRLIAKHDVACWLVNTGWSGGAYGVGQRMPIHATRRLLAAALSGELHKTPMRTDPHFGFQVPQRVRGIDAAMLNARASWRDKSAYDAQAHKLVKMFTANFEKFSPHVDAEVQAAAPAAQAAA